MTRRFGKIDYVQTWEKHQSGFPHVNIVISNAAIWEQCQGEGWKDFRQWLRPHAVESGFGTVTPWIEPLRTDRGLTLAGYLTKLSRELTGAGVKNQVPVNAPPHFRRIRASQGLLPAIHRPGKHQGLMTATKMLTSLDLSPEGIAALIEARTREKEQKTNGVRHEVQVDDSELR